MLQLLFMVIFAQSTLIMLFLFNTTLRNFIISGLDLVKRGCGPLFVKTVCGAILVVLCFTVYSSVLIHHREGKSDEAAELSTTEQLLFAKGLLQSSLMGFILFLTLFIDRLHIRELNMRRKTMDMEARKKKSVEEFAAQEEINKMIRHQISQNRLHCYTLKATIRHLESELENKIKEAHASEANVVALRKQSEGILGEYDRLLSENQKLRKQLRTVDRTYSHSTTKKES